jgi:hypothetical protein
MQNGQHHSRAYLLRLLLTQSNNAYMAINQLEVVNNCSNIALTHRNLANLRDYIKASPIFNIIAFITV